MIRFDNVTKQYRGGQRPALNAIDLEILRGEFVFLVGASGSGKSSCLRLILKEERPSSGAIHVLGQNLGKISSRKVPHFRRNIGVVFQDFRLLPNKSVFDNVAFSLQVIGKSKGFIQEAVPDTLKMVGLAGKASRLPHELSGGEQQRVAIARAVVNKPAVLLADEPTGNLDPTTSAGIMALLERINAAGTTVVMATHEAGIVDQMKRRVIELSAGSIIRDESQGGYGQTESITVVHDGVLVVAGDETITEEPAPVLIEQQIEPDEVPVVDLRVPATDVPAAAVTGSFRARPAQTGLVPTVEVVPDPIGSTVVELPEDPAAPTPVEPTPAPSPFFGTDTPTVTADGTDVVVVPAEADAKAEEPASATPVPANPVPATAESAAPSSASPAPEEAAPAAPALRGRRGSSAQAQPTAPAAGDDAQHPGAPTPSADQVGLQTHTGLIFLPADTGALPEESLAARLGLRPADDGEGDDRAEGDEQNVGPVK